MNGSMASDGSVGDRSKLTTEERRHTIDTVNCELTREMFAHEIKFTRTDSCTPGSCVCLLLALMLIFVGATSGLYYGSKYTT